MGTIFGSLVSAGQGGGGRGKHWQAYLAGIAAMSREEIVDKYVNGLDAFADLVMIWFDVDEPRRELLQEIVDADIDRNPHSAKVRALADTLPEGLPFEILTGPRDVGEHTQRIVVALCTDDTDYRGRLLLLRTCVYLARYCVNVRLRTSSPC